VTSQKVCVVTGASSGVGAAAAETFASAGIQVVLSARREDRLKELVEKIVAAGGEAVYKVTDVTKADEVQALFDFAVETYGGVDYVFSNAGYNGSILTPLTQKTEDEIVQILMINTAGCIFTLKSAVPVLKQRGGGAIVFTSSILGHSNYKSQGVLAAIGMGGGGALVYAASKAAVDMISRSAGQFVGDGIRSYSLQIGAFDSEMSRTSAEQLSQAIGQEVPVESFGTSNPICDTLGKAEEVGKVALALFDGTSAWKPGQTILVDNDLTADAAAWTCALDAPLDTDSGLPTKEMARELARDLKGNVRHTGTDAEEG